MENHYFSEPIPFVRGEDNGDVVGDDDDQKFNNPSDDNVPTWKVTVYRKQQPQQTADRTSSTTTDMDNDRQQLGGAVPVSTLYINCYNLPPRYSTSSGNNKKKNSNNKKIVWQLPNDTSIPLKFGLHEKTRMWELYKQQKKERRRSSKSKNNVEQEQQQEDDDESNNNYSTTAPAAVTSAITMEDKCQQQHSDDTVEADGYDNTIVNFKSQSTQDDEANLSIPPPPGFVVPFPDIDNESISKVQQEQQQIPIDFRQQLAEVETTTPKQQTTASSSATFCSKTTTNYVTRPPPGFDSALTSLNGQQNERPASSDISMNMNTKRDNEITRCSTENSYENSKNQKLHIPIKSFSDVGVTKSHDNNNTFTTNDNGNSTNSHDRNSIQNNTIPVSAMIGPIVAEAFRNCIVRASSSSTTTNYGVGGGIHNSSMNGNHAAVDNGNDKFSVIVDVDHGNVGSSCSVQEWLTYYYDNNHETSGSSSNLVQSTLIVGTAAATCTTPQEREKQWNSLTGKGTVWELTGWTSQTIPAVSSFDNDRLRPPVVPNNNHPIDHHDNSVLVAMTGTTIQRQTGWFSFTLTLVLCPIQIDTTTTPSISTGTIQRTFRTTAPNGHQIVAGTTTGASTSSSCAFGYVIVNEILTLFPLSTTTTTVASSNNNTSYQ